MKLLFCWNCNDLFKLHRASRACKCGSSIARYLEDGDHVEVIGDCCDLVGIDNRVFWKLSHDQRLRPNEEKPFTAWMYGRDYHKIGWRQPDGTIVSGQGKKGEGHRGVAKQVDAGPTQSTARPEPAKVATLRTTARAGSRPAPATKKRSE